MVWGGKVTYLAPGQGLDSRLPKKVVEMTTCTVEECAKLTERRKDFKLTRCIIGQNNVRQRDHPMTRADAPIPGAEAEIKNKKKRKRSRVDGWLRCQGGPVGG